MDKRSRTYDELLDHILDGTHEEYVRALNNSVLRIIVMTALDGYDKAGYGIRGKMGHYDLETHTLHVQMYLPPEICPAELPVELTFTAL